MNKRLLVRVTVYGLLQWVILNLALFVLSLLFGIGQPSEMTAPPPFGFVVLAVIMAGVAAFFARLIKITDRRLITLSGVIWSGMTLLFMLVTTIANGTQANIFGNWGAYFVFVSQALGSLFVRAKPGSAVI